MEFNNRGVLRIDECNSYFERLAATLWPGNNVGADFKPGLSLVWGDLSSKICLSLADHVGVAPERLAAELCSKAEDFDHWHLRTERGYINLIWRADNSGIPNFTASVEPIPCISENSKHLVVLAEPDISLPKIGFVRLLSAALLQVLWLRHLGNDVQLMLGDQTWEFNAGFPATLKNFSGIFQAALGLEHSQRQINNFSHVVDRASQANNATTITAWMPRWALSQNRCRSFIQGQYSDSSNFQLQTAEEGWLIPKGRQLKVEGLEFSMPLLVCLSHARPAHELEPVSAGLNEKKNLCWWLHSTQARLTELVGANQLLSHAVIESEGLRPLYRDLLVRIRYFEYWFYLAAKNGQIRQCLSATTEFLQLFGTLFYSPRFRLALNQGHISDIEFKIISGVLGCLSSIIRIRRAFEFE